MDITGSRRIVLIEDEPISNELICSFLRALGHEVEGFEETENLTRFLPNEVDLIISDLLLPKISTQELFREIEEKKQWNKTNKPPKCLFISARRREEISAYELRSPWGAVDFLEKPFTMTALDNAVRRLT
jgi:DNA-binding response OmpR family regulator